MFYKFNSEQHFRSFVNYTSLDFTKDKANYSVIGKLSSGKVIPEVDSEGNPTGNLVEEYLEGFHVNISGEVPQEFEPFKVSPDSPIRIFG